MEKTTRKPRVPVRKAATSAKKPVTPADSNDDVSERIRATLAAAIGGLLFMLSDSLLAWNRFHSALPLTTLWVLGSYYAALWFIARSVAQDEAAVVTGLVQTGGKT